ncbi:acetyl-CoA carboxylase 2 [Trichinella spiralis]|uniref:acetyl-CoA carboxylase 2 n=1 Tax=Trichinella spiralis TaxID=6334 RepID=UPI0001EFEDD0|nr:acetyl-CoA carboxylase 2 [Trichinella spiralis]
MNGSGVEGEFHRMSDGGMLLSYNSNSYTCYMNEEVHQYRVIIGNNKTIEFQKKYNPTEIRSPSAGKGVQYLVEDGDHVGASGPVAEIEEISVLRPSVSPLRHTSRRIVASRIYGRLRTLADSSLVVASSIMTGQQGRKKKNKSARRKTAPKIPQNRQLFDHKNTTFKKVQNQQHSKIKIKHKTQVKLETESTNL